MNKVLIGQGNLQDFTEDYEKVALANKGRMWSQLFPTGKDTVKDRKEFNVHYEWTIGYEDGVTKPVEKKELMI